MRSVEVDALVIATVNAPHSGTLSADDIAFLLSHPMEMRSAIGPMSSFFYELDLELQRSFARGHGIPQSLLQAASDLFDEWSGARRAQALSGR